MDAWLIVGFVAGLAVAAITAPVGVSGAVFLLPIQLSVLSIPSLAVTPTNLLFNIVSIPGALARYRRTASLRSSLTRLLLAGTVPGVVVGALMRVFVVPDERSFKLIVAALLLPLGAWLLVRTFRSQPEDPKRAAAPRPRTVVLISLVVGVAGGIYGIGGGSLISPILVGRGMPTGVVAPAALTSTFITSLVGATTYGVISVLTAETAIAPDWTIGIACGIGGLIGGYLGAHYRTAVPEPLLKAVLGGLALTAAAIYAIQAIAA